jgi:hypothetical protein
MTNSLQHIQAKAVAQLQQSPLLQTCRHADSGSLNSVLQQLARHCTPTALYQAYNQRPQLVSQLQLLPSQLDISLSELVKLLMLQLIADFSTKCSALTLTADISENYQRSVQRIYQQWVAEPGAELTTVNDLLLKDIGLLSGALLPCTERVIEPYSILQRYLMHRQGVKQAWRLICVLLAARGNKPVCRLHIHLAEINSLTAHGWRLTCLQLAQLLELNPQLKGVVGSSWFYDPAIAAISPKLAFINKLLNNMQASIFFSHTEDESSGALSRSVTRQNAYTSGQYQPKNYVIFIPRNRLLTWYKRQTAC